MNFPWRKKKSIPHPFTKIIQNIIAKKYMWRKGVKIKMVQQMRWFEDITLTSCDTPPEFPFYPIVTLHSTFNVLPDLFQRETKGLLTTTTKPKPSK